MKNTTKFASIAALSMIFASQAHAAWQINEVETETTGANIQFVELYNPVPNSSVAGLTVLDIRSSLTSNGNASSSINLTGSAVGNYYLIGNQLYNTSFAGIGKPAPDAVLAAGQDLRGQYHQVLLVNTADLPIGFTSGAAGYQFAPGGVINGTEFSNGTQIIDSVQLTDGATDPVYFAAQNEQAINTATTDSPFATGRFPDGTGTWQGQYPIGATGMISTASTPKAANTFQDPAAVNDWSMY